MASPTIPQPHASLAFGTRDPRVDAWLLVACVVWSVATGASDAAPAAYAVDVAPPRTNAVAMSTSGMLSDFCDVVGPAALGLIADFLGAEVALTVAAVLLAGAGMFFARLRWNLQNCSTNSVSGWAMLSVLRPEPRPRFR